jgi:hypothetical protein
MRRLFFPMALGPLVSFAQPEPSPLITDASLGFGFQLERSALLSDDDWRRMLPGSSLLLDDLPTGNEDPYPSRHPQGPRALTAITGLGLVHAGASLALCRKREGAPRFDQRMRIVLIYAGVESVDGYWSRSASAPYDTLVSSATGEQYVLDSIWTERYTARHARDRIGLDATYIVHRRAESRFSWYLGLGVQFGVGLSGNAEVDRAIIRETKQPSGGFDYEYEQLSRERFRTPATGYVSMHALFGVDLRLGRKSAFWSALHLYAEMRPTIMVRSLPNLPAQASGAWQNLFGLRIDLR